MGSVCDRSHSTNPDNPDDPTSDFDPEVINQKFENYIFQDKFIDFLGNKYDLNDPVFRSLKKEENNTLEKYYISQKREFQRQMTLYLQNQNINFVNLLTKQIIDNEGGRKILTGKIKSEIENIKMNKKVFNLKYLTVMLLGLTGTGKSCLINNLLFNGEEKAKENRVDIGTTEIEPYRSETVPYLRLVDSRGIELEKAFSINAIGDMATEFINEQFNTKNINKFIHCIWYCISSDRFQKLERTFVDNLIKTLKISRIPVIIVLTQSDDEEKIAEMRDKIKNLGFKDIIDVMAKRKILKGGNIFPPHGLEKLVEETIKKCESGFDGLMRKVYMEQLTEHINKNLSQNNNKNKSRITRLMKKDTFQQDRANQNFDGYINDIYYYNVCYFLGSDLSSKSKSLIKDCQFNMHKNNFFAFCNNYIKNLISKELPNFANVFLDLQATKEIEKGRPLEMSNKRNYKNFIMTSEKFLNDNFNYFSFKLYIYFVITNISDLLSTNFEQELNKIVGQLMITNEIQDDIGGCFRRKFDDFKELINHHPAFHKSMNYYNKLEFNLGNK